MYKNQDYSGIDLPDDYYKAEHIRGIGSDKEWLGEQLLKLTSTQRAKAADYYSNAYRLYGRQYANHRMLAMVDRSSDIRAGRVGNLQCV